MIEHALRTGAEEYLETQEHLYSWWQLAMLDVQLLLMAAIIAVLGVLLGAIWLLAICVRPAISGIWAQKEKAT